MKLLLWPLSMKVLKVGIASIGQNQGNVTLWKLLMTKGRPIEGVVELISSSCWNIHGEFEVDGIDTEFLVDTGSTYTILDMGFYKDIS